MSDKYLIWSNEHRCWWRPDRKGYTGHVERAGRYDRAEAIEISRGWPSTGIPDEVPVLERDAIECFAPYPQADALARCEVCRGDGTMAYLQPWGRYSEPATCYKCEGTGRCTN